MIIRKMWHSLFIQIHIITITVQMPVLNLTLNIITEEWQRKCKTRRIGEFLRHINPDLGYKITHLNRNRQKEVDMTRIRFGKNKLNYYLNRTNLNKTETVKTAK